MNGITYIAHKEGDELAHYGVKGQKWGVRRAELKTAQNQRISSRVNALEKKAYALTKKSERFHSTDDLKKSNKYASKAATYRKKAVSAVQKSSGARDAKRDAFLKKAATLKYKAATAQLKANRISKSKGYGVRAMRYSIKSDKVMRMAAKGKAKIESNIVFINAMKRRFGSSE